MEAINLFIPDKICAKYTVQKTKLKLKLQFSNNSNAIFLI